jgi:hypothetical protein
MARSRGLERRLTSAVCAVGNGDEEVGRRTMDLKSGARARASRCHAHRRRPRRRRSWVVGLKSGARWGFEFLSPRYMSQEPYMLEGNLERTYIIPTLRGNIKHTFLS